MIFVSVRAVIPRPIRKMRTSSGFTASRNGDPATNWRHEESGLLQLQKKFAMIYYKEGTSMENRYETYHSDRIVRILFSCSFLRGG